jgi:hypothetical protein
MRALETSSLDPMRCLGSEGSAEEVENQVKRRTIHEVAACFDRQWRWDPGQESAVQSVQRCGA